MTDEIICSVCQRRGERVKKKLRGDVFIWPTVTLELDPYEAANLLRHMRLVWAGKTFATGTGDWCGQVPIKLQAAMEAAGPPFVTHIPNAGGKFPFEP